MKLVSIFVLVVAFVIIKPSPSSAAPARVDLEAYWAQVEANPRGALAATYLETLAREVESGGFRTQDGAADAGRAAPFWNARLAAAGEPLLGPADVAQRLRSLKPKPRPALPPARALVLASAAFALAGLLFLRVLRASGF